MQVKESGNGHDPVIRLSKDSKIVEQMRNVRKSIERSVSEKSVEPICDYLYYMLGEALSGPSIEGVSCKSGCSFCCSTWVYATAPEILYLASSLRTGMFRETTDRVLAAASARHEIDQEVRALHLSPCPLLHSGKCTFYETRPAACRTAYSLDAAACEGALGDPIAMTIPVPEAPTLLRAAYSIALDGALLHAGFSASKYEIRTALGAALSRADADCAWLRQEEIFDSALREEEEHFMASPIKRAIYDVAFG